MSLILDALKKSESARLRNDHPAMFEAPRARPRSNTRWWVPALVMLLVANLALLAFALWRSRTIKVTPAAESAAPSATAVSVTPSPPRRSSPVESRAVRSTPAVVTTTSDATAAPEADGVPTITRDDLLASGLTVPEVSLGLHVYDSKQAARFVFLNGQKLAEGAISREGLRVVAIMPRVAVLEYRGSRFAIGTELP